MFRSSSPLSREQIARYAPSVLATEAHHTRGERYAYIPTINVLDELAKEGFLPFAVGQTRTRIADRREHTKHLVRLRHASLVGRPQVGDSIPEIVLVNSHDGTSSYQLSSGFFRLVCSNGMVVGRVTEDVRVRHSGDVAGDVIEGCTRILDDIQIAQSRIQDYQAITLTNEEQRVFANAALQLRWDEDAPVVADSVLRPRRWEDNKPDLWTTFNRVQESLLKGGVRGRNANGRRMTTREVGGVSENVKLNKALWSLADGMAQLKEDKHILEQAAQLEHAFA